MQNDTLMQYNQQHWPKRKDLYILVKMDSGEGLNSFYN